MVKSKFQHFQCCRFSILHVNKCKLLDENYFTIFVFLFLLARKKIRKGSAPHSSCTLLWGGSPAQKTFQKKHLPRFCESSSLKIVSQNRVHCIFSVSPHFPFLESSVRSTEARSARGMLVDIVRKF